MNPSTVKVRKYQEFEIKDFGKKLKQYRLADGRSAQVLATFAGISIGYWYQLEKEEREWISAEVLRGIESVLGVDFGIKFDV